MAPKRADAAGKKPAKPLEPKAEEKRKALEELEKWRRENAIFLPSSLDGNELIKRYVYMWGRDTKDHKAPVVLPKGDKDPADSYPFFCTYFYYGLVPPFSDFFSAMMYDFGFRLLDFTPNAMTCMAVFAHLCENFVGVAPNVDLFCHFFVPRIKDKSLAGSVTCIPRAKTKGQYLAGQLHLKWEEWRAEWPKPRANTPLVNAYSRK